MTGRPAPEDLPEAWRRRWAAESPRPSRRGCATTRMRGPLAAGGARRREQNARTVERVRRLLLPPPQRLVYPVPAARRPA